jgi:hypothetical protein
MWQLAPDQGRHEEEVHHGARSPELEARNGLQLVHGHSTLTRQEKDELDNVEDDSVEGGQLKIQVVNQNPKLVQSFNEKSKLVNKCGPMSCDGSFLFFFLLANGKKSFRGHSNNR